MHELVDHYTESCVTVALAKDVFGADVDAVFFLVGQTAGSVADWVEFEGVSGWGRESMGFFN